MTWKFSVHKFLLNNWNPLLHQPSLVTFLPKVMGFIRNGDLDSIELNVLASTNTQLCMPHISLFCSCGLISYSNVFFVNAFRVLDSLNCWVAVSCGLKWLNIVVTTGCVCLYGATWIDKCVLFRCVFFTIKQTLGISIHHLFTLIHKFGIFASNTVVKSV